MDFFMDFLMMEAIFFFLSKLLPPLVYPLGLASVLMLLALVLLWKRPAVASLAVLLGFVALMAGGNGWLCSSLVRSLERQHLPVGELPQAGAIVVLGGATRSPNPPRPWVEVNEAGDRPIYGARLFLQDKAPFLILSGGRLSWTGEIGSEAEDMAQLVQALGVPESALLLDHTSLNTRENAENVQVILEEQGIEDILLVTSAIHMPRSLRVFQKLGITAIAAPTDFLIADSVTGGDAQSWQAILLNLIPDAERLALTTRALKEYLGLWVYQLRGWA